MRAALIPVKELAQAKMRLADVLDRRERAELALAMLTDVIAACHESGAFDKVCVVSVDPDVLRHAGELSCEPISEPATSALGVEALNESLSFAIRRLMGERDATEVVIIPADIPLVQPSDIRAVIEALASLPGLCVCIAPSADNGTNALALRPPDALPMRFGANSAGAHRRAAADIGVAPVMLDLPGLRFDVDSPEDLRALASSRPGAATTGWLDARAHDVARRSGDRR